MAFKSFERGFSAPHYSPDRACAGIYTDLFFPESSAEASVAQRVCAVCPVLIRCAEWALREDITDGVVASVWMPRRASTASDKRAARAQLQRVASTGLTRFDELGEVA